MKIKNMLNAHEFPYHGKVFTQPSLTVPDETMSMREILSRYSRGLPIASAKEPIYHGEDDFIPDPRTLDLVDRQEFSENLRNHVAEIKEKGKRKNAARAASDLSDGAKAAKQAEGAVE